MLAEPDNQECIHSDYSDLYDALNTLKKGISADNRTLLSGRIFNRGDR